MSAPFLRFTYSARRLAPCRFLFLLLFLLSSCHTPPTPAPSPLPHPQSSSALALSPDGALLAAVNPDSGSVTLVDARTLAVLAEVPVGDDPHTASFTPDGSQLLITNYGSGTLSFVDVPAARAIGEIVVGGQPYGVVAGTGRAYVSLSALGQVVVIDLASRAVIRNLTVEPFPTGLALTADQSTLYVTHLYSGRVIPIDLASLAANPAIPTGPDANLSQHIALSSDGARAYLPQTRSNAGNLDLTYDSTAFPVVNLLDLRKAGFSEKPGSTAQPTTRIELGRADRPVNLPFAAALSPDGQTLYVANAGSDDVSVVDLATHISLAHLAVGRNPRGLALSPDGARLFVNNTLDGTLDIFDTLTHLRTHTLHLTTLPLPENILTGKRLFNSARAPMSRDGWLSCATCHFDGGADGRTWLGFPDGPRDTPALFGVGRTLPLHWSGDLDELQDVELTIRHIQFGEGLIGGDVHDSLGPPNAARSAGLEALAAYLASLPVPDSPHQPDAETLRRGARAFERWGCAACHTPPLYTDLKSHESQIGDPALERNADGLKMRFDTPSLLGAWATAPYFHDGSAPALRDTLFSTGFHSMGFAMDKQEVEDILAFMQALPRAVQGTEGTMGTQRTRFQFLQFPQVP
ncbi:MAG: beta-propeller fold lactonase family protein [Anaerolineales bacterium]